MEYKDNTFTISLPDIDDITLSDDSLFSYDTNTYISTQDYTFDTFGINPGIDLTQGDLKIHNDGDIKLGDNSLKEFMNKVEERLNILQPNPELEDKWNELKELGDKYRELEKELTEKQKMWDLLNKK